ncbi:HAD family hydrolase [Fructobacillus tropaeoli]|uniref:Haloacid dehalogenase n=1 Tax=Fructobacillus tropaeoli TaxID=709323 RepID=A0A3F3GZH2_9LACO|nr:HAD family phosphatase [Fructobacillus tropaeoli]GAP03866.1 haloacid dehalogenase [Fructobacillus tropaeoli]
MSGKEYLIFDLDGTLVDSMPFWENLATELLHRHGIDQLPADLHDRIQTMTLTDSAVFIQELFALPVTAESLAQEMRALMDQHYRNDIPLKVGVYAYLQNAYQSGRKIVLATASSSVLAKDCLRRLKLLPFFDFVFFCEDVGQDKTQPTIYQAAARYFGQQPNKISVYEDALYAASTAKRAGFHLIGVYDHQSKKEWTDLQNLADETIDFATVVKGENK